MHEFILIAVSFLARNFGPYYDNPHYLKQVCAEWQTRSGKCVDVDHQLINVAWEPVKNEFNKNKETSLSFGLLTKFFISWKCEYSRKRYTIEDCTHNSQFSIRFNNEWTDQDRVAMLLYWLNGCKKNFAKNYLSRRIYEAELKARN